MNMHHLLLAAQPVAADTVAAVPVRDAYDLVFAVAAGAVSLAVLGTVVLIFYTFAQLRRATKAVEATAERIGKDPGVESLRKAAGHLESISGMAGAEAEKLRGSISALSDRLTQASDRMEERIEEFNALMEVVQGEVEEVFVDTASTARGVRAGVARLGRRDGEAPGVSTPEPSPPIPRGKPPLDPPLPTEGE